MEIQIEIEKLDFAGAPRGVVALIVSWQDRMAITIPCIVFLLYSSKMNIMFPTVNNLSSLAFVFDVNAKSM